MIFRFYPELSRITEHVILSGAAVALCQSQMNLLLERCCMGVVYQIEDLDNSSKDLKVLAFCHPELVVGSFE
ncbi:MAG: hypothetical protein IJU73_06360 [Ruminococcus sp.]|nr:hypothetical protein [Ruminococcus sp.]